MTKKLLALGLSLTMALSLAACGGNSGSSASGSSSNTDASTSQADASASTGDTSTATGGKLVMGTSADYPPLSSTSLMRTARTRLWESTYLWRTESPLTWALNWKSWI